GEIGSARLDGTVFPAGLRIYIGTAIIEDRVEFGEGFHDRGATADPDRHLGENLPQFGVPVVLVLIALLEKEDEQRDADADQNYAKLRKGVSVIFEKLFLMPLVLADDAGIDDERYDQEADADQHQTGNKQVTVA